jgi:hypothetical protein
MERFFYPSQAVNGQATIDPSPSGTKTSGPLELRISGRTGERNHIPDIGHAGYEH